MRLVVPTILLIGTSILAGCASDQPKPRIAQEKTYQDASHTLHFAGKYYVHKQEVILTVNGDPVMRGHFPPFTPTLNMSTKYQGLALSTHCYFGSVLGDEGGAVGLVAGLIQSAKSKSSDVCQVAINGQAAEKLYF